MAVEVGRYRFWARAIRSLQRALYEDETGRRLTNPNLGPLFTETWDEDDIESGTIYVLRSLSDHPFVAVHRELIHRLVSRAEDSRCA